MSDEVLATITASAPRRIVAIVLIGGLALLLVALALFETQGLLRQLFLLALGAVFLGLTDALRRATQLSLELTAEGLRDSSGRMLVRLEEIAKVERGTFAFKPSNGFTLRLHARAPRGWAPGLWWRFGKAFGVGGMISKTEGRFMADTISGLMAGDGG